MKSGFIKVIKSDSGSMIAIYIVLFTLLALFVPYFFTFRNVLAITLAVSQIGIVACSMMFCLATRDFDLSVGSQIAFYAVLTAILLEFTHSIFISVILILIVGLFIGYTNGFLITKVNINAFIATLGTMQIVRGLAYIIGGGRAKGIDNDLFSNLATTSFLGFPLPVWFMILCFIIFGFLLKYTTYGRNALASGGNPDATIMAGVNLNRLRVINFTIQGLLCAIAGLLLAARISSGQPNAALGFELNVIAACILGGVSLSGGKATMTAVIIGVFIMGTLNDAMNLLNISAFYQYVVRGCILLAAVGIDQLKNRR